MNNIDKKSALDYCQRMEETIAITKNSIKKAHPLVIQGCL